MDRQMIRIITALTVLAHNVTQENKKIHYHTTLPSVLWHCWLGGRKGIRPVKNMGQWWRLALVVWMEWRPVGGSVFLPLLISPCTIKSRSSLLAPAHPGGPGKRAIQRVCVCVCDLCCIFQIKSLILLKLSNEVSRSQNEHVSNYLHQCSLRWCSRSQDCQNCEEQLLNDHLKHRTVSFRTVY